MDAYSSYIMSLSEARTSELRREAAEYALSRAARRTRGWRWTRIGARLGRHPRASVEPVVPTPLPAPRPEEELRRSA